LVIAGNLISGSVIRIIEIGGTYRVNNACAGITAIKKVNF